MATTTKRKVNPERTLASRYWRTFSEVRAEHTNGVTGATDTWTRTTEIMFNGHAWTLRTSTVMGTDPPAVIVEQVKDWVGKWAFKRSLKWKRKSA